MDKKIVNDLLLTKAMADSVGKLERWGSLNDIVDEIFENGVIDRDEYLHSIMELTQLGFIHSDIESEEDIEMSEAVGYDIQCLTDKGMEYINTLLHEPTTGEKVKDFFKKFNVACERIVENPVVKLTGSILLPALALL